MGSAEENLEGRRGGGGQFGERECYLLAHVPEDEMVVSSICHQFVTVLHQPRAKGSCICNDLHFKQQIAGITTYTPQQLALLACRGPHMQPDHGTENSACPTGCSANFFMAPCLAEAALQNLFGKIHSTGNASKGKKPFNGAACQLEPHLLAVLLELCCLRMLEGTSQRPNLVVVRPSLQRREH